VFSFCGFLKGNGGILQACFKKKMLVALNNNFISGDIIREHPIES
jgi:hypothetical protein